MARINALFGLLVFAMAIGGCSKDKDKGTDKGGDTTGATKTATETPKDTGLRVVQVAAGLSAACALMDSGVVRCWGRNNLGEHGVASSDVDAATPVEVPGITTAKDIWMGGDSGSSGDIICVRLADGGITCWGSRTLKPQQGESKKKWVSTPEDIPALKGIKDLALGGGTQYAIMPDGKVMGWGSPAFNAFGTGDTSSFDKPMTEIPGVTGATALAAGQNHACALLGDGTVTCWGYVTPKQAPKAIEGLTDVMSIASGSGGSDTCAIKKDKTLHCWGEQQTPKQIEGLSGVAMVRGRTHMCAATSAGVVYCWGSNGRGQLGNGQAGRSAYKPQKVQGLDKKVVHLDAGSQTTCAALDDGTAKCWGYNQRGQLGDSTLIDRSSPVDVSGITSKKLAPSKDGADNAQESEQAMDWSGLPAGCTKADTLEAKNPKLKGEFNVVSAYANSNLDGKTIGVAVGNFKMDPKKSWDPPRGHQFKLSLKFGKVDIDKKEAKKVEKGSYVLGLKQERKVMTSASHKSGGGMLASLSLEGVSPGTVTITHLDDDWICGDIDVKTKNSAFKGPYAARFVKKK